jgi:hypothetical protein
MRPGVNEETIHVEPDGRKPKDLLPIIRTIEVCFAGTLTGIVAFLLVYRAIRVGALWRDEVATLGVAAMPSFSQLWSALPHECCPVLPYLALRAWTGAAWLGGSDLSLRMMAALIGLGILSVFWLHRKALGYSVPIFSLVLFGLNATVLQWWITIRGYGLGILFILLAFGLIWKVVTAPSKGRVALAAVVSIVSVQCLYQNALFLFAICAGGALVCIRMRRWRRMLLVLGIGAVSAVSLVPYLATMAQAREALVVLQEPYSWSYILDRLSFSFSSRYGSMGWTWVVGGAVCIAICSYYVVCKRNDPKSRDTADLCLFNLTVMVLSTILLVVFLKSTGLHPNTWHYIALMGILAMAVDIGIEQASNTVRKKVGRLAVACVLVGVNLPVTWQIVPARLTNLDLIASAIEEQASEGDLIVLNPYWLGITFQHYYKGKAKWMTIPPVEDLEINRFDLLKGKMSEENPLQPVWDEIESTLQSGNRLWLIGDVYARPAGELPPVLPPAPNGREGWLFSPYSFSWGVQLGHFLNLHVPGGQVVRTEAMDRAEFIPGLETPAVRVGSGWQ